MGFLITIHLFKWPIFRAFVYSLDLFLTFDFAREGLEVC